MDAKTGFFYLFSVAAAFAAFRVITARNPCMRCCISFLLSPRRPVFGLLLKAEFLAIALVLVYLGAVMVLFLFVVMMLDIHIDTVRKGFLEAFSVAATVGALIALEMAAVLLGASAAGEEPGRSALLDAAGQVVNIPTPRRWVSCCTHSTCIPLKSLL